MDKPWSRIASFTDQRANLGLRYLVRWLRLPASHPLQRLYSESHFFIPTHLWAAHGLRQHTYLDIDLMAKIVAKIALTHRANDEWSWYAVQEVLEFLRNFTKQEQDLMHTLWRKYYE